MKKTLQEIAVILAMILPSMLSAAEDLPTALRRSQYLLTGTLPTDANYEAFAGSTSAYREAVRNFVQDQRFYDTVLRYHERILGVGLPEDYLDELLRDDIDGKEEKFASITCGRFSNNGQGRFSCIWSSNFERRKGSGCPVSSEIPVSVFWYPGIVAWSCPSVVNACGQDLSLCFIRNNNETEARNSELGTTESFDSRFAVMRSLSRQAAGIATAIAIDNYPYTKILEPGLTAVDGAIGHFYNQTQHFRIDELNLNPEINDILKSTSFADTRFKLLKTSGSDPNAGGVISSFGWLRRYDKNRTRANEIYKRLLCRNFVSDIPRVFPLDPGDLRVKEGCKNCHSVLDPLADFFLSAGEGADLYSGRKAPIATYFNGQDGSTVADLANIVRNDQAFATCTVQNVFKWLMGRGFYADEDDLRTAFTDYFVSTSYSFRELTYAIATHPAFLNGTRSDGVVLDPLEAPPLGTAPSTSVVACEQKDYTFAADIEPKLEICIGCHTGSGGRQDLRTEAAWASNLGLTALQMMGSGQMPPGPFNSKVEDLKTAVKCWKDQAP